MGRTALDLLRWSHQAETRADKDHGEAALMVLQTWESRGAGFVLGAI